MVSRRNFFTIVTLLLIMIFMFMFSSVIKQEYNDYGINAYASDAEAAIRLREDYDIISRNLEQRSRVLSDKQEGIRDKRVLYLGKHLDSEVAKIAETWCTYSKRPLLTFSTLRGLVEAESEKLPEIIVVDGEDVTWELETDALCQLAENGACVIFARMPSVKEFKYNENLRRLAGIRDIYSENISIDGIRLFPGFFIGNEEEYKEGPGKEGRQDLDLMIPWYVIGDGTKTYMMGVVDDRSRKSEYLPALVWRHSYGTGKVFCINGDYVTEEMGIGFLTACLAERDSYDIYPVINAQNLVLASYGGLAEENGEALDDIYDQKQVALFRDIVWPALVAMDEKTKNKMSLMVSPQLDYEDDEEPIKGQLIYYLRLLNEGSGEAGISTRQISSVPLSEKLAKDRVYWQAEAMNYLIQSAYLDQAEDYDVVREQLPDLRTVVVRKRAGMPVSYLDDMVTCQMATSYGLTHSFSEDLILKSYETALGYSNVVLDMSQISYPEGSDFADFSRKSSSNLVTYWKQYSSFAHTTISDSDLRIRRFLALDYEDGRDGNVIHLHVDQFDETAYFVLKLNRDEKIDEISGGSVTGLKNGFYLLEATEDEVTITLKSGTRFIY